MTMLMVNIAEAKSKLSEFLEAVARGELVVICKRNQPIAELRAVAPARIEPRPIGLAHGRLDIPDSFFAPLPDEVIDGFYGVGEADRRRRVAKAPPQESESTRGTPNARSRAQRGVRRK